MPTPTSFAARTTNLRKFGIAIPINLCNCTELPSTVSTIISKQMILNLLWYTHFVASSSISFKVWKLSKHQNKSNDSNRKGGFFTPCASQINTYTLNKSLQKRSKMELTENLMVHILPSNPNDLKFRLPKKRKQRNGGVFVSATILNSVTSAFIKRKWMRTIIYASSDFLRLLLPNITHNFNANYTSRNVSPVQSKENQTRSFICRVYIIFLRSSRQFHCKTTLLWFFLPSVGVFMPWTISVREG